MADPPEVTILLLGDAEVGKSTFLSYVSISPLSLKHKHVHSSSQDARRISKGTAGHSTKGPITLLRDGDQPFIFDIRFFNKPYRFEFYDTASPESWKLLNPNLIVLCYDISSRLSLINIQRLVCPFFSNYFY